MSFILLFTAIIGRAFTCEVSIFAFRALLGLACFQSYKSHLAREYSMPEMLNVFYFFSTTAGRISAHDVITFAHSARAYVQII